MHTPVSQSFKRLKEIHFKATSAVQHLRKQMLAKKEIPKHPATSIKK